MSIKNYYKALVNATDQHPFDPAGNSWLETDQGIETNELIGRLFHPEEVVRLVVTEKTVNSHQGKTVCAIEGKAKNLLSSLEEIPGILTALVEKWTKDMTISLAFNPVGCDSMFSEYSNAAIVIEGMDTVRYRMLVHLICASQLPVVAILCGDVSVMFVRVNATNETEYMDRVNSLIDEMKTVFLEMKWSVTPPRKTPFPSPAALQAACTARSIIPPAARRP